MKIICSCGAQIECENSHTHAAAIMQFLTNHQKCIDKPKPDLRLLAKYVITVMGDLVRTPDGDLVYLEDVEKLLGVNNE